MASLAPAFNPASLLLSAALEIKEIAKAVPTDPQSGRMYAWDAPYKAKAKWLDGRICLSNPPVPYIAGQCGGSPIGDWGFYDMELPCSEAAFGLNLFQAERYLWCQNRLKTLLASKPAASGTMGKVWASWTIEVMRITSMARWAMNMSSKYVALGPRTLAAIDAIKKDVTGPARNGATKIEAGDQVNAKGRYVLTLWSPVDLNSLKIDGTVRAPFPTTQQEFDPVRNYTMATATTVRDLGTGPVRDGDAAWPWPIVGMNSPGGGLLEQMAAWFDKTGVGGAYWAHSSSQKVNYRSTTGCPASNAAGASQGCGKTASTSFWYGTARATVAIAEAMAQDIINTSFGKHVADALKGFLTLYESIPPALQVLTGTDMNAIRAALSDKVAEEQLAVFAITTTVVGGAAAAAAAINPIGAIIVAVLAAVAALIVGILTAVGAIAIGGGELHAAYLEPPVVRQIVDMTGRGACDFDLRAVRDDASIMKVLDKVNAIRATAAAELPVSEWYKASKAAAERDPNATGGAFRFIEPPPPVESSKVPLVGIVALGAALFGAYYLVNK